MLGFGKNTGFLITLVCLFTVFQCGDAFGDIYRFVDEDGKMHFTNDSSKLNSNGGDYDWFMTEFGDEDLHSGLIGSTIAKASKRYGVDIHLIKAVIKAESNFDKNAVSKVGARGLMQLMPATAKLMGVQNIHDVRDNIDGGVKYLKYLLNRFGNNTKMAVAAYNAGETVVRKYAGVPPYKETQKFVKKVFKYRLDFQSGILRHK